MANIEYVERPDGLWAVRDRGPVVAIFGKVTKLIADGLIERKDREDKKRYGVVRKGSAPYERSKAFFNSEEECRVFIEEKIL